MKEFNISLSINEYKQLLYNAVYSGFKTKKNIILAIILIIGLIYTINVYIETRSILALCVIIMSAILFLIVFILFPIGISISVKKLYDSDKEMQEIHNYKMDEEKIIVSSTKTVTTMAWSDLYKFKETKDCIYLYITNAKVWMMPKSKIDDDIINYVRIKCQMKE